MPPTRLHVQVNPASSLAAAFTEARLRAAAAPGQVTISFGQTPEALEAGLAAAEVLLLAGQAPLHDLPRRAPHLRWISYTSAGVEWLLQAGLPEAVTLTNASGTHIPKAAEFTLLSVLMLNNQMPHFATAQRERRWAPKPAGTVAGRTALILGMGALGGAAAQALAGQGMRIIGNSHSGRPHPDVAVMTRGGDFRAYLPDTDVLIITLPLTPATHGLIGRAELDLLPPHAGVVNLGRGEILDADALAAKLRDGSLAGAVLDALPQEPLPPESPLWDTPNLVITPHCGLYDPGDYAPRCLDAFFANLARFRAGEPLHQVVDPARGY
ncbi:NAD(P)-dependent oxidoreductase [Falsiroseomonas sp.]|uniref:NAD(P)-dependent oxidoreductase n=1 Tax=Falsiroseomonas sp. TaxID=2870721 RepID=UPI002718EF94|nr:NAD(P)-dependent oxidoreductase [Falsiroseomonas sp.]MDO9502337.1 NAD(P)-dependent oxidoreductase [Falsiroseomonas sp.]